MKITAKTFARRSMALPAGLVIAAAAVFGGVAIGNATKVQPQAVEKPVAFVIPADMPVNAAPVPENPETYAEVQMDIAQKQKDADAAAALLLQQQQAAEAAAKANQTHKTAQAPAGPIKCPAGSSANTGDGPNDTSCFPDICFHIVLPDPAHPECVTAFKP